ncbi:MAG: response regulator [Sterolibacterium sp.]|nr:response regulator [Sterolibacterium sp.]MBP9800210.1 response regulator [Sterolibacterium sp.]
MNLRNKHGLLVDDNTDMRNSLRAQLSDCGLEHCVAVRGIREALAKLGSTRFDLVVCDYNLGQGSDGQQFLELIRRKKLLPLSSAFLMVTAESGYQQVSTAAEYSPDDYLLKPFTAEKLATRILRIFEKKEALKPIYRHMVAKGNPLKALEACDQLLKAGTNYPADVLRLKGELLLRCGRHDEAREFYDGVLAQRSVPWALVGKAQAFEALGNTSAAANTLESTLAAYPNYLVAYDLLAGVRGKVDKKAAQEVVEQALKVSASTQRQRELGGLALENKDFERAETALRAVVERDRTGFFKSHDDYAQLSQSCVAQGKHQDALAVVKDMGHHFQHDASLQARQAALECQILLSAGDSSGAQEALGRATELQKAGGLDAASSLEVAQSLFASGQNDEAKKIIQSIAEDHHENSQVLDRALAVFDAVGMKSEGEAFLGEIHKRMIRLNNEAVAMAKQGELDKAVASLTEAANRLRNNAQVSINAAQAILMRLSKQGMNHDQLTEAHRFITQAAAANPEHPKLAGVVEFYRKVAPPGSLLLNV